MKLKFGKYKHFKGNYYEVTGIARHSETLEDMVIYKALYQTEGENIWVRPLSKFLETAEMNGEKVPRFEYCGE